MRLGKLGLSPLMEILYTPLPIFYPVLVLKLFLGDLQAWPLWMLFLKKPKLIFVCWKQWILLILLFLIGSWRIIIGLNLFNIKTLWDGLNVLICSGLKMGTRTLLSSTILYVFNPIIISSPKFLSLQVILLQIILRLRICLLIFIQICGLIILTIIL